MPRRCIAFLLGCAIATLAGCNTISGFGKDVEAVGGGVSGSSAGQR